jgi:heme-degrading monooxygenase HmoA
MIQITTKPGQIKDCVKTMVERGLPLLKQQAGFVDSVDLTSDTDRDRYIGVTIWKSKEDAEKFTNGQGRLVLDSIENLLQGEPIVHTFNVEASTVHNIGLARAASSK